MAKLRIDSLTTVLYDRQRLCRTIGLAVTQLPLLACLLGNDVVAEERMQHIRNEAMAAYRCLEFYLGVCSQLIFDILHYICTAYIIDIYIMYFLTLILLFLLLTMFSYKIMNTV